MHKIFKSLLLLSVICFPLLAGAQFYHDAAGIRVGTSIAGSYKWFFKGEQAIEAIGGFRIGQGVTIAGLYQYHMDIGFNTQFDWYFGGGAVIGLYNVGHPMRFSGGLLGNVGIEYTFRQAPINVSIDYQPVLGYAPSYYETAFTARYVIR